MAGLVGNKCQFKNCGLTFKGLGQLIRHIEETHIDFSPEAMEECERSKPPFIPMSYVLRFFPKEEPIKNLKIDVPSPSLNAITSTEESMKNENTHVPSQSPRVITSTGISGNSETEEGDFVSEAESSNDSWGVHKGNIPSQSDSQSTIRTIHRDSQEKRFACDYPGCSKRYKNNGGLKYHKRNGHKEEVVKLIRLPVDFQNSQAGARKIKCPCIKNCNSSHAPKIVMSTVMEGHEYTKQEPNSLGSQSILQRQSIFTQEFSQVSTSRKIG